ncbi:MAG: amidohydrolase family protein [Planktotalea arctica]|uniref:amidohydrolase family protein n=1 Tax=Planktotalea arctica TaxID=1481893 RepID=UPI00321A335D
MFQFDCHAHVFETGTAIPDARYVPKRSARLSTWLENLKAHGIKGGVLVQVSFLGTDNSQLCAALEQLDPRRFAGVAVVPLDVSDMELDRLVKAGVRGVRWNLVRGAAVPDATTPLVQTFLEKLRSRNLHLELHLEGPRLAQTLPALCDQGIALVVDHFGLPSEANPVNDPMLEALSKIHDRDNIFFKFSAPYRTAFDLSAHSDRLVSLLGEDQVVWGSDWPHTQHDDITFRDAVRTIERGKTLATEDAAIRKLFGLQFAD